MTLLEKLCCCGGKTSGIVCTLMTSLLLATPLTSQGVAGVAPVYLDSQRCQGSGNCSLHVLDCGAGALMAVLEASQVFQPLNALSDCAGPSGPDSCPQQCCSYNESSDCKAEFSADSLGQVQGQCSHSRSCEVRAPTGNNSVCSNSTTTLTSSYSIMKALCVPDSVTVDPCTDSTVTGRLVSLYHAHPPLANTCSCRVDVDANSFISDTTNIQITAYDVRASAGSGWAVSVRDWSAGVVVKNYSGATMTFPAESLRPLSTSSLRVEFTFHDSVSDPQRVWLGFQGDRASLTMRCGQDAKDYEFSMGKDKETSHSGDNNINSPNNKSPNNNLTSDAPEKAKRGDNSTSTDDGGGIDTTDIIVYAAVGVSCLIVVSFMYVCIKKVRKRGCPSWCPPVCRDLECGKHDDSSDGAGTGQGGSSPSTEASSGHTSLSRNGTAVAKTNGTAVGAGSNGHVVRSDQNDDDHFSVTLSQRYCSFENKRPRGSLHSLRRPSFGDLENIRETEEESRFSTHHNPSHLNLAAQEEIFRMVDSKLAPLALDMDEEDDEVFTNSSQDTAARSKQSENKGGTQHPPERQSGAPSADSRADAREEEEKEEREEEEEEEEEEEDVEFHADGRVRVKFRLGGDSESSDPDLEHHVSKCQSPTASGPQGASVSDASGTPHPDVAKDPLTKL